MIKRILALVAIGSLFAFAQTPATTTSEATGLRATASQEEIAAHQTRMQTALDANDYATWKSEHDAWNPGDTRFEGKVTAENFPKFAEMVKARKAGDMATANQLRDELGLEVGQGGKGQGKGQGKGDGSGMGQGKGKGDGSGQGQGMGKCKNANGNCGMKSGTGAGTGAGAGKGKGKGGCNR